MTIKNKIIHRQLTQIKSLMPLNQLINLSKYNSKIGIALGKHTSFLIYLFLIIFFIVTTCGTYTAYSSLMWRAGKHVHIYFYLLYNETQTINLPFSCPSCCYLMVLSYRGKRWLIYIRFIQWITNACCVTQTFNIRPESSANTFKLRHKHSYHQVGQYNIWPRLQFNI